ncbi:hypothetical protein Hdeb2414_s0014g00425491 [Helianthus debilis subsp. tardiflorus]
MSAPQIKKILFFFLSKGILVISSGLNDETNGHPLRDYPSNKLSNYMEHRCNFQKLGTKGEILPNHRD